MQNIPSINSDLDVVNVIEERDEQLIADEIIHGSKSSVFVYEFEIKGRKIRGISVAGAEYLARRYGNLKHKIIATSHKVGKKFTLTSYDPLDVKASIVDALEEDPDHYQVVIQITDLKNNNTRQITKSESCCGYSRHGEMYDKPHYTTIAENKAYRNAVLSLVPKDVQEVFKNECIKANNSENMTESLMIEKRRNCIAYAESKGIIINNQELNNLNWDELNALSISARVGVDNFKETVTALGLVDGLPKRIKTTKSKVKTKSKQLTNEQPITAQPKLNQTPIINFK